MLPDQADSHALVKHAATRRVEELNASLGQERDARRAVEELVPGLFAPGTLHSWVGSRLGSAVADAPPGPTATHAEVVAGFVPALMRRGLVDARLFELLAEGRPEVEDAVWVVAGRWGCCSSAG